MSDLNNILVIQTAFIGDVVLTLPLIQTLKENYPSVVIDVLVVPRAGELLEHHPAVHEVLLFDKRGSDSGVTGFLRQMKRLRARKYDCALVPHRSLRSAALAFCAKIPLRVGFHTSAGRLLFTDVVHYEKLSHEVDRNVSLVSALKISAQTRLFPNLYPTESDRQLVDLFLSRNGMHDVRRMVAVAPGTVWNTKRWPEERFVKLTRKLGHDGFHIVLIGGSDDAQLCERIVVEAGAEHVFSAAGKFTLLQSAELIRRCRLLVSNDSAPMHLAVAVGTPVIVIYGATIPAFGFSPYGTHDQVVETTDLPCRPCSIHGGSRCPIDTFECMKNISSQKVYEKVVQVFSLTGSQ